MSHSIAGVEFGGPVARLKCITNGIVVGVPTLGAGLAVWHGYNYGITLTTVLVFVPFYFWTVVGLARSAQVLHASQLHREPGLANISWHGRLLRSTGPDCAMGCEPPPPP